ncbi:MAG TPA: LysM peptidoglycan-binding domain-containing protein [Bacteriovoracaceae bacterium]|nr:LysM peptidoglycan-binding domain-containing protein [Bacteriovoracaceae bacterium]
MKKFSVLSSLTVAASILLASCSSVRPQQSSHISDEISSLSSSVELSDDEIFEQTPKTGEYLHEMAEADADDSSIKKEIGFNDADLDEDLPGTVPDRIPYAKSFLSLKNTKRMQFWVNYFTKKQRDRFQRFINNGEEYRHHIEEIFQSYGLPKELYYVGLIESGYYLGAKSHASAVGPWQFIRGTGSRYGLRISGELDERQDLFKASHAAARYFKDLHNMFSNWELSLAAYNAGENGMQRRIIKYGTRDFYQLSKKKYLPSETINYVPKVLAAMHVVQNAQRYGFDIPKKKHRLFDLTELRAIKKNVPLFKIASKLNVDTALLKKLNPELRREATPRHFGGTYFLRVPKTQYSYRLGEVAPATIVASSGRNEKRKEMNRRTAFILRSASEDKVEAFITPKVHKVRRGETLISIAKKFELSPKQLASFNNFKDWKTRVQVGQKLQLASNKDAQRVVTRAVTPRAVTPKVKLAHGPIVYKVRKGDNLTDLARIFNLKVSKLKTANKLRRGSIMVGQRIVLPNTQKGIYTVKRGENLTRVAKNLNQPMEALIKLNSLKRGAIYPGQKIIVNMD